jgi:uncharacterized alpha/beta hydrolase family protein
MIKKVCFLIGIVFLLVIIAGVSFSIYSLQEKKKQPIPVKTEIKETFPTIKVSQPEIKFDNGEYEIKGEKYINGQLNSIGFGGKALIVTVNSQEKQFFLAQQVIVARGNFQKGIKQESFSSLTDLKPGSTVWLKLNSEGKISQLTFFEN